MRETYEYINNLFKNRFFDGNHKAHSVKAKALFAIIKQIPQKPIYTRQEIVCSTCRTLVGSSPYCGYCGQMLDHSDRPTEKQIENNCSNCNRKGKGDPACQLCVSAYDPFTNTSSTPSYWQPIPETKKGDAK